MNSLNYFRLATEQYLRELSDDEFDELTELVRAPKGTDSRSDQASFLRSLLGGGDD